jgi:hypothetical protein
MRAASIRNAARMHGKVPGNPARGEAQGRIGVRPRWPHVGPQTGVEAQKSKPRIVRAIAGSDHPDENQSGVDDPAQTARGPDRTEMSLMHLAAVHAAPRRSPDCGIKPAKGQRTPGAPPDEFRGKDLSSGRAA